jgi:uncharacterized protein YjbJ (UPF0337 family)
MNSDNLEGAARGVIGKAQESVGEVTGDAGHHAEGMARQVAGRAQDAYGDVVQAADQAAHQVERAVRDQPVVSLLVAGAVGYALGLLTMGMLGGGSRHRYW